MLGSLAGWRRVLAAYDCLPAEGLFWWLVLLLPVFPFFLTKQTGRLSSVQHAQRSAVQHNSAREGGGDGGDGGGGGGSDTEEAAERRWFCRWILKNEHTTSGGDSGGVF